MSNDDYINGHALIFGELSKKYLPIIMIIKKKLQTQEYEFMAIDDFQKILLQPDKLDEGNRIYWTEMLHRAHLAAVSSIVRNLAWMEGAATAAQHSNYLMFASALRSLIESIGDSTEVLVPIAKNIARDHRLITSCLNGSQKQIVLAENMENTLIHYSHARKISKQENAPESHNAKRPFKYVGILKNEAEVPDVGEMYAELCEAVHPAARSVFSFLKSVEPSSTAEAAYTFDPHENELLSKLVFGHFHQAAT